MKDEEARSQLDDISQSVLEVDKRLNDHLKSYRAEMDQVKAQLSDSEREGVENQQSTDSEGDSNLQELQAENKNLRSQLASLQSEGHVRGLLQEWIKGLSEEGFIRLGVKLGYDHLFSESLYEESPSELNDPQGDVLFSETIPEGEDGWEHSDTLGCFVKVTE